MTWQKYFCSVDVDITYKQEVSKSICLFMVDDDLSWNSDENKKNKNKKTHLWIKTWQTEVVFYSKHMHITDGSSSLV